MSFMKRVFSGLVFLSLVFLGVYLYLLSPSAAEKEGDRLYQAQDFAGAGLAYTRSLAVSSTSFASERVLFKAGNAYRLASERDRAFDFYLKLLREYPDSVYKPRIQEFLKEEQKNLTATAPGKIQLDLSFLQKKPASLEEMKGTRDQIYLSLLQVLTQEGSLPQDFEVRQLYQELKKADLVLEESRSVQATSRLSQVAEIKRLHLAFLTGQASFEQGFKSLDFVIKPKAAFYAEPVALIQASLQNLDGLFFFASLSSWKGNVVHLQRLAEVYENTKIFVILVEESLDSTQSAELDKDLSDLKLKYLVCKDESNCLEQMHDLIQVRSLWQ